MKTLLPRVASLVVLTTLLATSPARAQLGSKVANWSAPQSAPSPSHGTKSAMGDVTNGLAFVGVTPCRVVDTRPPNPPGPFGPPKLVGGSPRSFAIPAGPCSGLPTNPLAYSLNITVTNTAGPGFILIYPEGGSQPGVSTLNYLAGQTIANAAVVASGTSAGVTVVAGVSGTDLIIDINGYYVGEGGNSPLNPGEYVGWQGSNGGGLVFGWNTGTGSGVRGKSTNGVGVWGESIGTTGILSGVLGTENSNSAGSSGVQGVSYSGAPAGAFQFAPAGVLGLADSVPDLEAGVQGVTRVGGGFGGRFTMVNPTTPFALRSDATLADGDGHAATLWGDVEILAFGAGAGNLDVIGSLSKGSGSFKIDHPLDPENKYLYHSFVESPDMMNIYNGNVVLDSRGEATVTLPDYFEALNTDFRYQLTSIGRFSQVYVSEEVQGNRFKIAGGRAGAKVSWQVTGIRQDAFAMAHRIIPEVEKEPEARGMYLHPREHGQPPERSVSEAIAKARMRKEKEAANPR